MNEHYERGSGSILMLMAIAIVAAVAGAVLVVSGGLDTRQRAQAAADLSAISAAAHALDGPSSACDRAKSVTQANGAALVSCVVVDGIAEIKVEVRSRLSWFVGNFIGRARAGPVENLFA